MKRFFAALLMAILGAGSIAASGMAYAGPDLPDPPRVGELPDPPGPAPRPPRPGELPDAEDFDDDDFLDPLGLFDDDDDDRKSVHPGKHKKHKKHKRD